MPKETSLELKVGLFVLMGLLALTVFIFSISDSSVFQKGKELKVVFNFANGLKKSSPVRVSGVEQGIVRELKLFFDAQEQKTKVEIVIKVDDNVQIPKDSVVIINQLGLLGEKYIEITPGMSTKEFYPAGATLVGKDPISQEALSEKIMLVANKLERAVGGVDEIVNDDENQKSVRETLQNVSLMTGGFKDLIAHVNAGQGTIGKLFYDDRLADDLQSLSADLKANPWKLLYRPKK